MIINTGTRAVLEPIPGLVDAQPLTHNEALELDEVPGHGTRALCVFALFISSLSASRRRTEELPREGRDDLEANHLSITHLSPRVPLIEARALLPGCGCVSRPLPMDGSAFVASRDLSVASHIS